MKKIAYLALSAMTLIGVYSCNDRDNNTTKTTNPQNKEKTPEQKRAEEYAKLIKKGGIERNGLFTVRKIFCNTKWRKTSNR